MAGAFGDSFEIWKDSLQDLDGFPEGNALFSKMLRVNRTMQQTQAAIQLLEEELRSDCTPEQTRALTRQLKELRATQSTQNNYIRYLSQHKNAFAHPRWWKSVWQRATADGPKLRALYAENVAEEVAARDRIRILLNDSEWDRSPEKYNARFYSDEEQEIIETQRIRRQRDEWAAENVAEELAARDRVRILLTDSEWDELPLTKNPYFYRNYEQELNPTQITKDEAEELAAKRRIRILLNDSEWDVISMDNDPRVYRDYEQDFLLARRQRDERAAKNGAEELAAKRRIQILLKDSEWDELPLTKNVYFYRDYEQELLQAARNPKRRKASSPLRAGATSSNPLAVDSPPPYDFDADMARLTLAESAAPYDFDADMARLARDAEAGKGKVTGAAAAYDFDADMARLTLAESAAAYDFDADMARLTLDESAAAGVHGRSSH